MKTLYAFTFDATPLLEKSGGLIGAALVPEAVDLLTSAMGALVTPATDDRFGLTTTGVVGIAGSGTAIRTLLRYSTSSTAAISATQLASQVYFHIRRADTAPQVLFDRRKESRQVDVEARKSQRERNGAAIALLKKWKSDKASSEFQRESLLDTMNALNQSRTGARKLYP